MGVLDKSSHSRQETTSQTINWVYIVLSSSCRLSWRLSNLLIKISWKHAKKLSNKNMFKNTLSICKSIFKLVLLSNLFLQICRITLVKCHVIKFSYSLTVKIPERIGCYLIQRHLYEQQKGTQNRIKISK